MNCGIGLNDPYLESLFYSGASWNPDSGVQGVSALAGSVVGSAQYAWQFSPASNQKFSPQALARSVGSKGALFAVAAVTYTATESMLDMLLERQTVGASTVAGVTTGFVAGLAKGNLRTSALLSVVFGGAATIASLNGNTVAVSNDRTKPYPGYHPQH